MFTNKQINEFKERLLEMKKETEKDLEEYRGGPANEDYSNENTQELSDVADHPANLGTEQFEREKDYTFYEKARERMMEIEDALQRIEEGKYGFSEKSGEPIPLERLEVEPTARFTVEESKEINER
ncbi:hypothetical protein [Thalassobacillus pellis]|uniref:hypothetical protein n=1 Tax=Thalassobacillus pellis TaxID=748008 RepID=UPI001961CBFD|nr:hypothetical protein [Thalassobacillus pellis]MBM7554785.1 RNA polymerase-binding transcription factor DksA [Thalassobacillus pellis]